MKTKYSPVLLLLTALAFAGLAGSEPNQSYASPETVAGDNQIPKDVLAIMQNSCVDCHGKDGRALAKSKLNMDEWDEYSSEKQVKKAGAMCKMVTKHKMPLKSYLKDNPEKALTQAQIDKFCEWSASLKK